MRWSAGRAVAYADVFGGLSLSGMRGMGEDKGKGDGDGDGRKRGKVVCLGGGAGAEVVGLGFDVGGKGKEEGEEEEEWDIVVVDMAPWGSVLGKLETAMNGSSSSVTSDSNADPTGMANRLLLDPAKRIKVIFQQRDILDLSEQELRDLCQDTKMVTLMFTLNELYSISIAKTTGMLLGLTGGVERGCLLVVVDSPGSYSTLALNHHNHNKKNKNGSRSAEEEEEGESVDSGDVEKEKEKEKQKEVKKYPMKWLLDHTLLEVASAAGAGGGDEGTKSTAEGGKRWEKIVSEDSRWCRLREELRYPIALEDMRMQVHVYRRL